MLQFFFVIFGVFLITIPATAQIYNREYQEITAPFDKVIEQTNALYTNVLFAGDAENAKPQDVRYEEMTGGVNKANARHFNTLKNELK